MLAQFQASLPNARRWSGGNESSDGRPTCALLPETINTARTSEGFGFIGNRGYTLASDNDAYFAIPGNRSRSVVDHLAVIVRANDELERFHRARAEA